MRFELLKRVLDNPEGEKYEWLAIMQSFWDQETPLTDEDREILERAAVFDGKIELTHCYDGPHSRPPEYFIRMGALRLLGKIGEYDEPPSIS